MNSFQIGDSLIEMLQSLIEYGMQLGIAIIAFVVLQFPIFLLSRLVKYAVNAIDNDDGSGAVDIPEYLETAIVRLAVIVLQFFNVAISLSIGGFETSQALGLTGLIGLAVGYAGSDIIRDVFGGLIVLISPEYQTGYWLEASDAAGFLEEIGLLTSTISDASGIETNIRNSLFITDTTIKCSGESMQHWLDLMCNPTQVTAVGEIAKAWASENPYIMGEPAWVLPPRSELTGSGIPRRITWAVSPQNYKASIDYTSVNPISERVYAAGYELSVFDIAGKVQFEMLNRMPAGG